MKKIPLKTITVPNRDLQGWLHGTKSVTVEWDPFSNPGQPIDISDDDLPF
ncbi:hypothetical protein [Bacillus thuringiensis]|nr:hypothetical protein [Bacillus thuringiensis]